MKHITNFTDLLIHIFNEIKRLIMAIVDGISELGLALLYALGPIIAPAGPAIVFSNNMYLASMDDMNPQFALISAIVMGLALECAGFISAKTTVFWLGEVQKGNRVAVTRLYISAFIVLVYIAAGVSSVFVESVSMTMKLLVVISFVITVITYTARALLDDANEAEKKVERKGKISEALKMKQLEFEHNEKILQAEHRREMARQRQSAKLNPVQSLVQKPVQIAANGTPERKNTAVQVPRQVPLNGKPSKNERDGLLIEWLKSNPHGRQREAAAYCGHATGTVNGRLKRWIDEEKISFSETEGYRVL